MTEDRKQKIMNKKLLHFSIFTVFTVLCLLFSVFCVYAQGIKISASVNKNVITIDDQLVLEVTVEGSSSNIPEPDIPDISDFTVYSSGRSQNVSIINGQVSSSINFKYVMVPNKAVKTSIPPITLNYNGKTYQTQRILIEVLPSGKPTPQQPQQTPQQQRNHPQALAPAEERDLFVTADVDKTNVYVNEQIVYTFRFIRRPAARLLSEPRYTPTDFSGFWADALPQKDYNTKIGEQRYIVSELKTLLFPTKSGEFVIKEASLACQVPDFSSRDFFSSFFSMGKTKVLQTKPITVNVKPLPEKDKPKLFNGAVGQYAISASIDKKSVKTNEPVTLSITIKGTGNVKTINDPHLPDWPDFKKYETVGSVEINKDNDILSGSKTFKTVIVPQTPGRKNIAPVKFSFFDPKIKSYKTIQTPGFQIEVKPGETVSPSATEERFSQIKMVAKDIRFIKDLKKWETFSGYIYERMWFKLLVIIPISLFLFIFIYMKWQEKLNKDVAFARKIRASGTAKKYLRKAKKLLNLKTSMDFYSALSRALLEYIANKTNVSADGLTLSTISEILTSRKVNPETIAQIKDILDECDMARFAPTKVNEEMMKQVYDKASVTISQLERELK
ncbi:MAG: protein BatD [Endomicrobiales bacterium]|nr:protein BatD [Endomicrobiales bacterium]